MLFILAPASLRNDDRTGRLQKKLVIFDSIRLKKRWGDRVNNLRCERTARLFCKLNNRFPSPQRVSKVIFCCGTNIGIERQCEDIVSRSC